MKEIRSNEVKQEEEEMIDKLSELKNFILLEEGSKVKKQKKRAESIKKKKRAESIIKKARNKTQGNQNFAAQKSVIKMN